ncbi:MAG: helix-turn-helix transcriptional regulator, partial [Candidatus Sericytochromatia bacterium]
SEAEKKYLYISEKIEKINYSYNYESIKTKLLIAKITLDFYYNVDIYQDIDNLYSFLLKIDNISLVYYSYSAIANIMISLHNFNESEKIIKKLEDFSIDSLDVQTKFIKIRYHLFKKEIDIAKDIFDNLNLSIEVDSNLDLFFTTLNLYISLNELELSENLLVDFFKSHTEKESIYYIYALIFKSVIYYKNNSNREEDYSDIFLSAIKLMYKSKSISILCEFSNDIVEVINIILYELNKKIRFSINSYLDLSFFDQLLVFSYQKINRETSESLDLSITFTKREIELLELLESRISNTEMSKKLFISPNTLKTHIKNIYKKLKVNDREEALIKYKAIVGSK